MSQPTNEERALEIMDEAVSEARWAVRYLILHMVCMGAGVWIIFTERPFWAALVFGAMAFFCSVYSGRQMRHSQELRNEADRIMGTW